MIDKKTILAVAICFLLMFLYGKYVLPMFTQEPEEQTTTTHEGPPKVHTPPELRPAKVTPGPARTPETVVEARPTPAAVRTPDLVPKPVKKSQETPQESIEVTTDLFRAVFTNEGAAIRSMTLLDFHQTSTTKKANHDKGDLKLLSELKPGEFSLVLSHLPERNADRLPFDKAFYRVTRPSANQVVFENEFDGIELAKTFIFEDGKRHVTLEVKLRNLNDKPISVSQRAGLDGAEVIASGGLFKKRIWKDPWPEVKARWVNSVAYRLALVASGQADATLSLSAKSEWDLAAGVLLVEEAGGHATDHKGDPFRRCSTPFRVAMTSSIG